VTAVPLANAAEHAAPQEMPAGALVTVPVPAPVLLTVSVKVCAAKVAVTVVAALSVTVQVPVPEQPPPLQPVKVEPAAGAAVKIFHQLELRPRARLRSERPSSCTRAAGSAATTLWPGGDAPRETRAAVPPRGGSGRRHR